MDKYLEKKSNTKDTICPFYNNEWIFELFSLLKMPRTYLPFVNA